MLRRDSPRWANRTHLFEHIGGCFRYLGFFNMRPEGLSPESDKPMPRLAESYLAPPGRMLYPPYHVPTLGPYSTFYGIPAFECTPFVMPHRLLGGYCAQACLFSSLVIGSSTAGTRAVGPFGITALAQPENDPRFKHNFEIRGLTTPEMVKVVRSAHIGANGLVEDLPVRTADERDRAFSIVRRYLSHGLPVVLCVDYNRLYGKQVPKPWHVILLLGFTSPSDGELSQAVYHDSAVGPYLERGFDELADASSMPGRMQFMVTAPATVAMNLSEAEDYFTGEGRLPEPPSDFTTCRLVRGGALFDTYFKDSDMDWIFRNTREVIANIAELPEHVWVKEFYRTPRDQSRGQYIGLWIANAAVDAAGGDARDPLFGRFDALGSNSGLWLNRSPPTVLGAKVRRTSRSGVREGL